MFPCNETHDPGGKSKLKVEEGIQSDALFLGDRQEYRPWLCRWIGDIDQPYSLFIGMNPSIADLQYNDPTVAREWKFSINSGLGKFYKTNILDYRATNPKDLISIDKSLVKSSVNLSTIRRLAKDADYVVLACGILPKPLRHHAAETIEVLLDDGIVLKCFGTTREGWPKHPLYLRGDTPLINFDYSKGII